MVVVVIVAVVAIVVACRVDVDVLVFIVDIGVSIDTGSLVHVAREFRVIPDGLDRDSGPKGGEGKTGEGEGSEDYDSGLGQSPNR